MTVSLDASHEPVARHHSQEGQRGIGGAAGFQDQGKDQYREQTALSSLK